MPLPLSDISDRFEIQDLLVAYSYAVDTGDWDALDDLFTDDALIDYTGMGGPRGDLAAIKGFLREALAGFTAYQHLVGLTGLRIDGDVAHGRTACQNPLLLDGQVLFGGLWYRDTFARTAGGWRFRERVTERGYLRAVPSS
jgi:hypothetical protein